jgi:uncharacterized membrane protein YfcA
MLDVPLTLTAVLAGTGLLAGFVDAIAGGGALLTIPALLLAGFDPVAALATNKLQSSFGSGTAVYTFARHGLIAFRLARPLAAATFAGACLGVGAVRLAPVSLLSAILPVLLIVMAVYFAFSPQLSDRDARARLPAWGFLPIAAAIGFYDGVFGPGTGSFFMLGFVLLLGYGVVKATAHTKLLNFTSNIAAFILFALSGKIVWTVGLAMGLGQFLGARVGSRLAIRHGVGLIRPLLVIVCVMMAVRLLVDPANPLSAAILSLLPRGVVDGARLLL